MNDLQAFHMTLTQSSQIQRFNSKLLVHSQYRKNLMKQLLYICVAGIPLSIFTVHLWMRIQILGIYCLPVNKEAELCSSS